MRSGEQDRRGHRRRTSRHRPQETLEKVAVEQILENPPMAGSPPRSSIASCGVRAWSSAAAARRRPSPAPETPTPERTPQAFPEIPPAKSQFLRPLPPRYMRQDTTPAEDRHPPSPMAVPHLPDVRHDHREDCEGFQKSEYREPWAGTYLNRSVCSSAELCRVFLTQTWCGRCKTSSEGWLIPRTTCQKYRSEMPSVVGQ